MSTAGPEIKALISLIDDPDDRIYSQVRTKLLEFGEDIIPTLESEWESNEYGLVFQSRIEVLIHEIQFSSVKDNLVRWIENGAHDLLEGVLIINRFQYPDLDEDRIKKRVHQLKQDVWLELNDNLTAFEQIRVINHILFDVYGFSGNKKNFHSPQNSFLNQVLDTGKGNPLMLSVIYLLVCRPLDLPVYGVNLPNHFVLAYLDTHGITEKRNDGREEVLFYINAFSRGTIFDRKEIEQFLNQLKLPQNEEYFYPCGNIDIVRRLLLNLISSYEQAGQTDKCEELKLLIQLLPKNI